MAFCQGGKRRHVLCVCKLVSPPSLQNIAISVILLTASESVKS